MIDDVIPHSVKWLEEAARRSITSHGARRVVWHSWGGGQTVLLLHGGTGSWRHWIRNIPALADRYHVIAPDLPGMGESDVVPGESSPQTMAQMLMEGLDELSGERTTFHIVGFSFGGLIGGHVAALANERTRSLTIVGTTGWPGLATNKIDLLKVRDLSPTEQWDAHRVNLTRIMIADPDRVDDDAVWLQAWHSRRLRIDTRAFYKNGPLTEVIPCLTCPVNGVWGERDAIAAPRIGERENLMRSLTPDLAFRIITGAGHWVSYEKPNAFNSMLIELLSRPAT